MTEAIALPDDPTPAARTAPGNARILAPYVLGVALIIAAHGVTFLVRSPHVPAAYTVFVAAVVLTALYGGFGPGLLVVTLASFDLTSVFVTPFTGNTFVPHDPTLIATCSGAALLCGAFSRPRGQGKIADVNAALLAATERERRRIGHDLHDGLGQELTGLSMLSSALADRLRAEGSATAQQADELAALARDSIRHATELARGLSPADLSLGRLAVALRQHCERLDRLPKVRCTFVARGLETVSPEDAVHLYRIVQEATANALRHGRATNVVVSFNATADGLTLRVADDGGGFDHQKASADGLGLRLMALRAARVGGRLDVRPAVSGGTVVTCHVDRNEPNHLGAGCGR